MIKVSNKDDGSKGRPLSPRSRRAAEPFLAPDPSARAESIDNDENTA